MKEIKALIQPSKLYDVVMALHRIPSMPGFITSDIRGFPRGHADPESQSHGIDAIDSFEMMKVECVVPDSLAPLVVETIARVARTGYSRDGRIIISAVEDAVKIRTGQHGEEAV
ncbi:MAG TPA: P-II family nitrogen regulator [Candidatus Polarisedimenticolia bacterium]|nr:P-II family nitrogen regulator [Candidatus Polarisedimenticolia bacterium]